MDKYEEIMELVRAYGHARTTSNFKDCEIVYDKLNKKITQLSDKLEQYEDASFSFLSQLDKVLNSP